MPTSEAPLRAIVGFHQDDEGHWVAELACGHGQHVRHDPPLVSREWVLTDAGRAARLGAELACRRCLEEPREEFELDSEAPLG